MAVLEARVYFAKVNPDGTSQICPNCNHHTGKKELSERVHYCSECGFQTDRDVAAAMVVMQRGLAAVGYGQDAWRGVKQ
ncbi:zinc ribbon domain-containing protein [Anabaena sp. UHCC 0399]|uniref:zinc ribbon domain-containing protein n=1 Tax=Anabaena sp. UHCC 0399 TaxID=3110238 RepID=UPI002B1FCC0B|nr:zinc ribbon domain-containing protein [Anabaena sp. UHCC 0399]MEA5565609.1 zinc ribbon domain-containing protein [Anabaena sp. UHCC 0399]